MSEDLDKRLDDMLRQTGLFDDSENTTNMKDRDNRLTDQDRDFSATNKDAGENPHIDSSLIESDEDEMRELTALLGKEYRSIDEDARIDALQKIDGEDPHIDSSWLDPIQDEAEKISITREKEERLESLRQKEEGLRRNFSNQEEIDTESDVYKEWEETFDQIQRLEHDEIQEDKTDRLSSQQKEEQERLTERMRNLVDRTNEESSSTSESGGDYEKWKQEKISNSDAHDKAERDRNERLTQVQSILTRIDNGTISDADGTLRSKYEAMSRDLGGKVEGRNSSREENSPASPSAEVSYATENNPEIDRLMREIEDTQAEDEFGATTEPTPIVDVEPQDSAYEAKANAQKMIEAAKKDGDLGQLVNDLERVADRSTGEQAQVYRDVAAMLAYHNDRDQHPNEEGNFELRRDIQERGNADWVTQEVFEDIVYEDVEEMGADAEEKTRIDSEPVSPIFQNAINAGFIETGEIETANALIKKIARRAGLPGGNDRNGWESASNEILNKLEELERSINPDQAEIKMLEEYLGRTIGILENATNISSRAQVQESNPAAEATETLVEIENEKKRKREEREQEDKQEKHKLARDGYLKFLEQEATYTSNLRKINPEDPGNAPDYYTGNRRFEIPAMTDVEQEEHLARIELREAAKAKGGRTLEKFAELYYAGNAYEQIKNKELEILEGVPGYVEARMKYVVYVENDTAIQTYIREKDGSLTPAGELSWHNIKGEADLTRYRIGLQQNLVSDILITERFQEKVDGLDVDSEEYKYHLRVFTQSAEQVAYNFLYSQHFFEMNQSRWEKDGSNWVRRNKSSHSSSAVSDAMLAGLKPIDVMVADMLKDHVDVSKRTGQVITKHGHNWIKKNADKKGVRMEDIRNNLHEVVLLSNEEKNKDKFWTFDNTQDGYRLYIFSQIPEPMLKQMYMLDDEKTTFEDGGIEKSVLQLMREASHINWSSHETANLFAKTAAQAEKVNQYIQMITSKKMLVSGTSGGGSNINDWVNELNKSVSDIKLDDKDELIRGIVHSSITLDPDVAAPSSYSKEVLRNSVTSMSVVGFDANTGPINYPWEPNAKMQDGWFDKLFNLFGS